MSTDDSTTSGTSYKVLVWKTDVYVEKRKTTYIVRWKVEDKRFKQRFASEPLAENFRSQLLVAVSKGEAFDIRTGLPISQLRKKQPAVVSSYRHMCAYVDMKWDDAAPNSRAGIADTLATIMPALLTTTDGAPDPKLLRNALCTWVLNTNKRKQGNPPVE